jgi:hypothetical protein
MASSIEGQIVELLLEHAGALPISPAIAIAYPNISFTPPDGETYLEAVLLPNTTVTRSVSASGSNQHQGILQISVMHPVGKGAIPALEVAGQVIEHFTRGTVLHGDGIAVSIIKQPWSAPPMTEPDRIRVPVSIPYLCFAVAN